MSNTGWYFRSIYGAPEFMYLGNIIQIPPKSFIMYAMRYPPNTQFNISILAHYHGITVPCPKAKSFDEIAYSPEDLYDSYDDFICEQDFSLENSWYTLCNDTGGYGPAWFWDGEFLYIRIVNVALYIYGATIVETMYNNYWEADGLRLYDFSPTMQYVINASCFNQDGTICQQTFDGYAN